MPDTGGHELTPSLASTVQETSIASTTSSGSSCVDNSGEEGGNFLLFLRRFGFGWSALVLVLAFSKLSIASFRLWNNIKVRSQLLYLQEHTVGLASDNIKKKWKKYLWSTKEKPTCFDTQTEMLRNVSPSVYFAHFQVYQQRCRSKHNERAWSEKHKRRFHLSSASGLDHQRIGWCSLPLWSAQSTPPNAHWVPNEHV